MVRISDIKLPVRGDTQSPSQSPPPGYEEYIVQKVVNVHCGNENDKNDSVNGHLEDDKVDLGERVESRFSTVWLSFNKSMFLLT